MTDNSQVNNDIVVSNTPGTKTTRGLFSGFIDAFSQIQQYAVIERSGQEIPDDFLTIRGKLNFFSTGFSNGFKEGLLFAFATVLLLPIMSDPQLRMTVSAYIPYFKSNLFLWVLNCLPIAIMGGMCCILSRYRIGLITRKAVDSLLLGRLFSLILKAVIIFSVLLFLGAKITPDRAWIFSNWVSLHHTPLAESIFRVIMNTKPQLINTAWEVLGIFFIAIIIPFTFTWLVAFYRKVVFYRAERFWES